jgi:hypothetical protein
MKKLKSDVHEYFYMNFYTILIIFVPFAPYILI